MQQFKVSNEMLPDDWLNQVESYDLNQIPSEQNKKFLQMLIDFAIEYKEDSLSDLLVQNLVNHICNGESLLFDLSNIPPNLLDRTLSETKGKKKFHFSEKLVSIFAEIATYQIYADEGFVYVDPKNKKDVTDLIMRFGNKVFDIQVKYKESNDTFLSRILDYICGMALLSDNNFLKNKTFQLYLLNDKITKEDKDQIWNEVGQFIKNKSDHFSGKFINIKNYGIKNYASRYILEVRAQINSCFISDDLTYPQHIINAISDNGFIDRVISKLKDQYKSRNIENTFIGVIVWDVAFHKKLCKEAIQSNFNEHLVLPFDLRVIFRDRFQADSDFLVQAKEVAEKL